MKVSSFDIFDTCLVRKCGTPENFFDIFSLCAFNGEVEEWTRQEFVASRKIAQQSIQTYGTTLYDIWSNFEWQHSQLKPVSELCQIEQDLEREMLVPVLSMRDKVNECRKRGDKIIFISDMYLSSDFLIDIMRRNGFYQDGDSLYVSCECEAEKQTGELFKYVRGIENITYRKWHHYGDNKICDYSVPRKLGIKASLINHKYTPYQQEWINNDFSLGFKYASVLAGIGRALHYSTKWNTHTDFVLDIIAPFYCSLVYRIMSDAEKRGINRLYFCARDAYMMYLIAEKYKPLFPSIESRFLYISKKSLYEGDEKAKEAYFRQEGVITQTNNVAIVDFRSTGHTLAHLNEWISTLKCNPVRGYYFEMFYMNSVQYFSQDYYTEANNLYVKCAVNLGRLLGAWNIYEQFFPLNTLKRTVGYSVSQNRICSPIFDAEEELETDEMERVEIKDKAYWAEVHRNIILQYTDEYCRIAHYSDKIFENCAIPCLAKFFETPQREYLIPLTDFYAHFWNNGKPIVLPYVQKCSPICLFINSIFHLKRTSMWRRGTLLYSIPRWLYQIVDKIIH